MQRVTKTEEKNIENAVTISLSQTDAEELYEETKKIEEKQAKETEKQETKQTKKQEEKWSLEIPKINLTAEIAEGTTEEILNKYIGHFENTSEWNGNIGLAAHNRRISCKLFWQD